MENLVDLNEFELQEIDGGILPVLCVIALCKGIGYGFAAGAAIYGAIELGKSLGSR